MLDQFDTLVGKLLDGGLDPEEQDCLNQLLTSEENRLRFVELNKLHFCLTQRALPSGMARTARAASAVHDSILSLADVQPGSTIENREHRHSGLGTTQRISAKFAALAAVAAVGLILSLIHI